LYVTFGLTVEKLWGLEDFSPSLGMLSATMNARKTVQIYPNLSKFGQRQNFETTKNREFSIFQKYKFIHLEKALEHVSTIWIFNPRIFHMLFYCQKMAFVCEY
jgi:hypothetical protein